MDSSDHLLPKNALPELVFLMDNFHVALQSEIKVYKVDNDLDKFKFVLNSLRQDLKIYEENFDHIYQNANNGIELNQLEELAKQIAEGKELLVKAIRLTH